VGFGNRLGLIDGVFTISSCTNKPLIIFMFGAGCIDWVDTNDYPYAYRPSFIWAFKPILEIKSSISRLCTRRVVIVA
jgi:hypothetical protein